jgi:Fe-S-cluster containining protein
MPLYNQVCPKCGLVRDALVAYEQRNECMECGAECKVLPSLFHTAGIIWSNQEHSSQLGTTWETNKSKREWLKAHPNAVPVSKGSQADRDFSMSIKQKAETLAKKAGFQNTQKFIQAKKEFRSARVDKQPVK